jgi:ribosome maturation factor RimP
MLRKLSVKNIKIIKARKKVKCSVFVLDYTKFTLNNKKRATIVVLDKCTEFTKRLKARLDKEKHI